MTLAGLKCTAEREEQWQGQLLVLVLQQTSALHFKSGIWEHFHTKSDNEAHSKYQIGQRPTWTEGEKEAIKMSKTEIVSCLS